MSQLSAQNNRLLIAQEDTLLIASPEGLIEQTVKGLQAPVHAAAYIGDEVAIAVDHRIVTTQGGLAHWRDRMRGFGAIGDLASSAQTLLIADEKNHKIIGYDFNQDKPFLVAGNGDEDITDGPSKEASLGYISKLSYMKDDLYFIDSKIGQLRVMRSAQIHTCEGGELTGAADLACGQMQGCGGFRIFALCGDTVMVYDPIGQSSTLLTQAPRGAIAIALLGCALFFLTDSHALVRLDLQTMQTEAIALSYSTQWRACVPWADMGEGGMDV